MYQNGATICANVRIKWSQDGAIGIVQGLFESSLRGVQVGSLKIRRIVLWLWARFRWWRYIFFRVLWLLLLLRVRQHHPRHPQKRHERTETKVSEAESPFHRSSFLHPFGDLSFLQRDDIMFAKSQRCMERMVTAISGPDPRRGSTWEPQTAMVQRREWHYRGFGTRAHDWVEQVDMMGIHTYLFYCYVIVCMHVSYIPVLRLLGNGRE